jgi:hypothetical protein
MSVEYKRYTIPTPNSFLPESNQVGCFLERASREWLVYRGWIAKGAEGMKLGREGATVAEAVGLLDELWTLGIRAHFPFRWPGREHAYDLELHASRSDYIYHISESVAPFESCPCLKCGYRLDYSEAGDIFQELRIRAVCPNCRVDFDPSILSTTYSDWLTGAKSRLAGGAAYRLALIVDNVPEEEWERFQADPSFKELSKVAFGCEFREIVDAV